MVKKTLGKDPSISKYMNLDVEELMKAGRKSRTCPYFLSREAAERAEIIFTPYNYLVSPVIRQAMGINVKDAIVIIDEAHNIEDACREAGSFETTLENLQGTALRCDNAP